MTAVDVRVTCGTAKGYRRHLDDGSPACDACREAFRNDLLGLEPDPDLVVEPEVEEELEPVELTEFLAGEGLQVVEETTIEDRLVDDPGVIVHMKREVETRLVVEPVEVEKPKRVRKARKPRAAHVEEPVKLKPVRELERTYGEPVPDDGRPVPWAERKTCEMDGCDVAFWDESKAHRGRFCSPAHKFEATRRLSARAQQIAWEPAFSRAALRTAEGYATYDVFTGPGELRFVLKRRGASITEAESWLAGGGASHSPTGRGRG